MNKQSINQPIAVLPDNLSSLWTSDGIPLKGEGGEGVDGAGGDEVTLQLLTRPKFNALY